MTFVVVVVVVVDKKYQMKHNERIYVSCLSAATERYHGCYSYFYDYYNDYFYTVSLLLPVVALWPAPATRVIGKGNVVRFGHDAPWSVSRGH